MAKKLLIDAAQPEEVRVAIVDNSTLEEFESETITKRQFKGNIYLAKVIRIEPSLQAAFVEYGGNRHGFLPFAEIHPDYYRIPISDREALLAELEQANAEHDDDLATDSITAPSSEDIIVEPEKSNDAEIETEVESHIDHIEVDPNEELASSNQQTLINLRKRGIRYKIQEVLTHRQIMLIQVVKEERGGKGAALTTYLSLPGRYCVLMPNAAHHAGGVSRKINDGEDRKRLKELIKGLEIPKGMALIVRTAGQNRNKLEIKRDFEYLTRLWEEIRDVTMKSVAPYLVYAEGDLVKRAIRDIYSKEMDEILIEGENAYKTAKDFMRALIPSHTKKIKLYKNSIPLLHAYKIEEQIEKIMNPVVQLPSGGSIVINHTEALVAVDVNSGKSTRERHIDETALKTNIEAADEVARQIRLRDIGGLVVVDFIDMQEQKHIQQVERRFKEASQHDRARLQIGRISQFGLLELSRQRLKPSVLEMQAVECSHCKGTGRIRSTESMALRVLRGIDSLAFEGNATEIMVFVPSGVDLYLLNQKRGHIVELEKTYSIIININPDTALITPNYQIDILASKTPIKEKNTFKAKNADKKEHQENNQEIKKQPHHKHQEQNKPFNQKQQNTPKGALQDMIVADIVHNPDATTTPSEDTALVVSSTEEQNKKPKNRRHRHRNRSRHKNQKQHSEDEGGSSEDSPPAHTTENVVKIQQPKGTPQSRKEKPQTTAAKGGDHPEGSHHGKEASPKKQRGWLRRLLDS